MENTTTSKTITFARENLLFGRWNPLSCFSHELENMPEFPPPANLKENEYECDHQAQDGPGGHRLRGVPAAQAKGELPLTAGLTSQPGELLRWLTPLFYGSATGNGLATTANRERCLTYARFRRVPRLRRQLLTLRTFKSSPGRRQSIGRPRLMSGKGEESRGRTADTWTSHRLPKQDVPGPDAEAELSQGLSRLGYAPTSDTFAFTRKALDLHAPDRGNRSNSEHINKVLGDILPKTYTGQSLDWSTGSPKEAYTRADLPCRLVGAEFPRCCQLPVLHLFSSPAGGAMC